MQSALLTFLLLLASLSKSVVTLHPPWFSVLTNDLVTLRCEGSGSPEDNSTCWYHNDTLIPVQTQNYSFKAYNMTYSGKYQCQKDQSELSEPVRLEVYQDWLLLQTLKLVYMEGEPMVLRCHSWENKFISKITFYKNGIAKQFSPHDFNFSINQVNYDDSGDYYCEANIGNRKKTSKVVRITVQDLIFLSPFLKATKNSYQVWVGDSPYTRPPISLCLQKIKVFESSKQSGQSQLASFS
ncbi:low affinity immunoglobulin gamma Fc region receptor II-a-like isoform X3 [Macrotis lagotis]|uniref:low affinity immunoglobulin gamma Fc region receptor II-a-like isoform X3 n=1 Tax=Macrotis lagotis TaxID=92651 RepID=UPI003D69433D